MAAGPREAGEVWRREDKMRTQRKRGRWESSERGKGDPNEKSSEKKGTEKMRGLKRRAETDKRRGHTHRTGVSEERELNQGTGQTLKV